jgi:hypothetical protein
MLETLLFPTVVVRRTSATNRRLAIISSGAAVNDAVSLKFAISDRLSGTSDVRPINVRTQVFDTYRSLRSLLNFNGERLPAGTLSISDLPEICDGRADLIRDGFTLVFGQSFEVGVESVHALTIANAFAKCKQMLS